MAKKKTTKKSGSKKSGSKKSKTGGFVNTDKLMGFAGSAFIQQKLLTKLQPFQNLDPKFRAGIKILAGEWLPKQSFATNAIKSNDTRQAIGDGMIYDGVKELMQGFGIAGLKDTRKVRGNEFLAVSIEGLKDIDTVNEDVLADDELGDDYEIGDDLDTVNEDVLADDEMGDDVGDDLDTVNEDVLGDDEMGDDLI